MRANSVLPKDGPEGQTPRQLATRLSERIRGLTRELVGTEPTGRYATEWRFRSRGSLAVVVDGAARGSWFDHETGAGGDALGLVAHLRRCPMRDAYGWALDWLGMGERHEASRAAPAPARKSTELASLSFACQLWCEAVSVSGTLAERYLRARGLALPKDAPLRFHPACPRGAERLPAMLARMSDPTTGGPCGVHRTFLAPDGSRKASGQAKMMLGAAGVVRLVPDEDVHEGLGLAEGIETALAVMQRFRWRPVWAATSAGGIARFPVLPGIQALTVFADADDSGVGLTAAWRCASTWSAAGREACILAAPAGEDFHDSSRRVA
jgi:hypothetical protein